MKKKISRMFYVRGLRHHAVVLAHDKKEAIRLSHAAERKKDARVLFGYVCEWEKWGGINVWELKLPRGYRIVKSTKP